MGADGLPDLDADVAAAGRAFRALFELAPVGVCAVTLERRIFAMNPTLQQMLGLSEYRGLLVDTLAPPEAVERLNAYLDAAAVADMVSDEGPLIRADGTRVETRSIVVRVRADRGEPSFLLGVIQSRDEELRSQDAEVRARLLVHDINNLLMPIVAYAELLLRGLSPSDPARSDAERVQGLVERAVALARASLSDSATRPDEGIVDVNGLLAGMRKVVADLLGAGVDVVFHPDLGQPHVPADGAAFERGLLNVVANARDAMPEGGTLTVETKQEGDLVRVLISDTGVGLPPEVRERVFESGFTTKGAGHGLGLASVREFAETHDGSVTVDSGENAGTTVTLTLPAAHPA
jgi:two-component system, cell cycle sensor histidine kinase and response regulator CckA